MSKELTTMINERRISKIALGLDFFCGIGWLIVTILSFIDTGVSLKIIFQAIISLVWLCITYLEYRNCKEYKISQMI